jgi:hypothetical protein
MITNAEQTRDMRSRVCLIRHRVRLSCATKVKGHDSKYAEEGLADYVEKRAANFKGK